jgi:hypothetical protein
MFGSSSKTCRFNSGLLEYKKHVWFAFEMLLFYLMAFVAQGL